MPLRGTAPAGAYAADMGPCSHDRVSGTCGSSGGDRQESFAFVRRGHREDLAGAGEATPSLTTPHKQAMAEEGSACFRGDHGVRVGGAEGSFLPARVFDNATPATTFPSVCAQPLQTPEAGTGEGRSADLHRARTHNDGALSLSTGAAGAPLIAGPDAAERIRSREHPSDGPTLAALRDSLQVSGSVTIEGVSKEAGGPGFTPGACSPTGSAQGTTRRVGNDILGTAGLPSRHVTEGAPFWHVPCEVPPAVNIAGERPTSANLPSAAARHGAPVVDPAMDTVPGTRLATTEKSCVDAPFHEREGDVFLSQEAEPMSPPRCEAIAPNELEGATWRGSGPAVGPALLQGYARGLADNMTDGAILPEQ